MELRPWRIEGQFSWWFKRSSTPSELTADAAELDMRQGTNNLTNMRNTCGYGDTLAGSSAYQGNTTNGAHIANAYEGDTCLGADLQSVVAFGILENDPAGNSRLAVACNYFGDNGINYDGDVKFNSSSVNWTTAGYDYCINNTPGRYNVEAVMTHERGHTFGVAHIAGYAETDIAGQERDHGKLTMSPASEGPCQASEATLGKGDILALGKKP